MNTPYARIFEDRRIGNSRQWWLGHQPPDDYRMRVPDLIKACVVFVEFPDDGRAATAFLVGTWNTEPVDVYLNLVTAAHVAKKMNKSRYRLRANRPTTDTNLFYDTGSVADELKLSQPLNWWYHPTMPENVDIAVAPVDSSIMVDWALNGLPVTMLLTDDTARHYAIGIGDETYTLGIFTHLRSREKNRPILRTGNLAVFPEIKVPTKNFGNMDAYLIEARSLGGLSGAPVFVTETSGQAFVKSPGEPALWAGQTFLLGVMHGHWDIPPDALNDIGFDVDEQSRVNLGVAIVSPAKRLLEILTQPRLLTMREQQTREKNKKFLPTEDVSSPRKPNRDIPIPPISRKKFFEKLTKATERKN
jgi:hypothetical protein